MKDKPKVSTKKNENSGKKWSLELDNELINLLSSNKDIMHISDVLKRSKRSIESRIIQVVNNNQHREINCDIFPLRIKLLKLLKYTILLKIILFLEILEKNSVRNIHTLI